MEIINPDLNIRFAWFGWEGVTHTLCARDVMSVETEIEIEPLAEPARAVRARRP
ncbi:hypothetical protein [Burkholderia multivorans]|uniref:hypothetical protein n=1 Tax=Burkholderia multivorans TaxID=87883 RepID=UPI000AF36E4B|nr:hypothetical protein [Burkholderia multivorans]